MLRPARLQPPVRRVLAVDAGSRRLKLALVKSSFGHVELLREESIDLHEEGLVTAEECKNHLQTILADCGHPPLALTISQHLSTSHIIELPLATESEVRKLIEDEAVKLSGVSESAIVYDFVRVESSVPERQQFWVTLSKERDIEERITQLGLERDNLCDVSTTANSLIAAYRAIAPESAEAILVHVGAQNTLIVVLSQAQAIFAGSFPVGSDKFVQNIATARGCSAEAAHNLQRQTNLLTGPEALPEFVGLVDQWATEVKRQLRDGRTQRTRSASEFSNFTVVASGNGFEQPGLLEHLNARHGLTLQNWPTGPNLPKPGLEIAYGTALQALGLTSQPVSLLPTARRVAWKRHLTTQKIEFANSILLLVCCLILGVGLWQKFSLVQRQEELLTKVQSGSDMLRTHQELTLELQMEYEHLRPLFQYQQNTRDILESLALIEQTRSNRSFWYVLVADQQSYFEQPSGAGTNTIGPTLPVPAFGNWPGYNGNNGLPFSQTNASPARPGLIAELCVPEDLEAARRVLSSIVNDLKPEPLFSKVDLLSDDLRRNHADPKVLVPNRHFALSLNFATTEFHPPATARARAGDSSSTRSGRWSSPAPETETPRETPRYPLR
jgi:Tfp pilus assembly PilM family ATPase